MASADVTDNPAVLGTGAPLRVTRIRGGRGGGPSVRELWDGRGLLRELAWRDIRVRYKQTAIGFAWALLRPLLTLGALTLVFGRVAGLESGGVPYSLLVIGGLLPWMLFATVLSESSTSLINNTNLVGKIYFPRVFLPLSTCGAALVDFAVSLAILGGLLLWHGHVPDARILALPLFIGLALLTSTGLGLWFAALNVRFRDFRYVVPFVVQFGLYLTPVGFRTSEVPESLAPLFALNPMTAVVEGARWSILGLPIEFGLTSVLVSAAISILLFIGGWRTFARTERWFADHI